MKISKIIKTAKHITWISTDEQSGIFTINEYKTEEFRTHKRDLYQAVTKFMNSEVEVKSINKIWLFGEQVEVKTISYKNPIDELDFGINY